MRTNRKHHSNPKAAVGDVVGKDEPVRCLRQPDRAARYRLMTSSGQVVRGS